jgi:hypothetical protein
MGAPDIHHCIFFLTINYSEEPIVFVKGTQSGLIDPKGAKEELLANPETFFFL